MTEVTKADDVQVGGNHYKDMPVQPWDVMEAVLSHDEFVGFLKGNIIKYSMRQGKKDSDDAGKAKHYRIKLREVEEVVAMGADEVDMVIDRGAFLSGRHAHVYDEIRRVKDACGHAHLKVILEVAELGTYDNVRRASLLAIAAGADFIKTSTGKLPGAATLPVHLVMLEAIRDVHDETGRRIGMKPAGGIRTSRNAIQYLVQVHETLGPGWLTPDLYRLGASSLLNDILMQIRKEKTGAYQSRDYFTVD